jgi:anti-sigma factor RsiW
MTERRCDSLDEFLAGELAAQDRGEFENHLADCASCRGAVADWRALCRTLQAASVQLETPSAALLERIERESGTVTPAVPRDRPTWRIAALVAAALLAAVVFRDFLRPVSQVASTKPRESPAPVAKVARPPKIEIRGDVIGVPIDIGDPQVSIVWLYPEAKASHETN